MINQLKSYRLVAGLLPVFLFLLPSIAMAAEDNPITKIKKYLKLRWELLDKADWAFGLIMVVVTLMVIFVIVYFIFKIVGHIISSQRGKATLWDKQFWLTQGGGLLIVFLLVGGFFMSTLEAIYDWTHNIKVEEKSGN